MIQYGIMNLLPSELKLYIIFFFGKYIIEIMLRISMSTPMTTKCRDDTRRIILVL